MSEILQLNVLPMYFLYGLSFYTMGIAIALQYRSYSSFRLAKRLSLLAAFALLHGLSEWGSVFIPVKMPDFGNFPLWKLLAIQRMLQSVSYLFLFYFGVKLIADSRNHNLYWGVTLSTGVFLGWLAYFARFIPLVETNQQIEWLVHSEYWSRYLLAFPAGLFTAYGLYLQVPELERIKDRVVLRNLWLAIVAFVLFAIFSGLVVPHRINWFSGLLNADMLRQYTGLPIELLRTATAILATWSITSMLAIFDLEKQRHIMERRRLEAVIRERERFARDLHDDVIQSIYGLGLELQTTLPIIDKDQKQAARQVKTVVERLNMVIHTLRGYIHVLETEKDDEDLKTVMSAMINQFRDKTGFNVNLNFPTSTVDYIRPTVVVRDWQNQLQQIIREGLNNIIRHAQASRAEIDIRVESDFLVVTVADNGKGMDLKYLDTNLDDRHHLGLRNMQARAALLGGDMVIKSRPGEGTRLVISIPLAVEPAV